MASSRALRRGLADALSVIDGVNVSPYLLSNPTPPVIEVEPGPVAYDLAMQRGLDRWRFVVRAIVALSTDIGAQERLDRMLESSGPDSIKQAIEADPTLGGICDDARVVSNTGYRVFERASTRAGMPACLGVEWHVDIFAEGA